MSRASDLPPLADAARAIRVRRAHPAILAHLDSLLLWLGNPDNPRAGAFDQAIAALGLTREEARARAFPLLDRMLFAPARDPEEPARQALRQLGLEGRPAPEQVRQRYRRLLLVYHPDRRGEQATRQALQINLAYATYRRQCADDPRHPETRGEPARARSRVPGFAAVLAILRARSWMSRPWISRLGIAAFLVVGVLLLAPRWPFGPEHPPATRQPPGTAAVAEGTRLTSWPVGLPPALPPPTLTAATERFSPALPRPSPPAPVSKPEPQPEPDLEPDPNPDGMLAVSTTAPAADQASAPASDPPAGPLDPPPDSLADPPAKLPARAPVIFGAPLLPSSRAGRPDWPLAPPPLALHGGAVSPPARVPEPLHPRGPTLEPAGGPTGIQDAPPDVCREAAALLDRFAQAYRAGDLDALLDLYDVAAWENRAQGRDAIGVLYRDLFALSTQRHMRFRIQSLVRRDDAPGCLVQARFEASYLDLAANPVAPVRVSGWLDLRMASPERGGRIESLRY